MVIAVFIAYAGAFVWRSSLVIFGDRYFCLMDDAMISMTYARNLAEGFGAVWYPGAEPVEGFTNPLWMLFMAATHFLPVGDRFSPLIVQVAGIGILAALIPVVRSLGRMVNPGSRDSAVGAMVIAGFAYPLVYWTLMGMEVGLLAFAVSVAVLIALRGLERDTVPVGFYMFMGIATLIRPDAVVVYLAGWSALLVMQRSHRARTLGIGATLLLLCVGGQTLIRMAVFGDPLPNTYYLKMTGYPAVFRMMRGGMAFFRFVLAANPVVVLLPFAALLYRRDRARVFLCWLVGVQCLYSVYVGGDSWESWGGANRFISTVLPLWAVLLGDVLSRIASEATERLAAVQEAHPKAMPRVSRAFFPAAVLVALVAFNGFAPGEAFLVVPPFQTDLNREMVTRAIMLQEYTEPDASVAVTCAGSLPYFSRRIPVDLLGKCDPVVAHEDSRVPAGLAHIEEFVPGHAKYDFAHSIGVLAPDAVLQIWGQGRDEMAAALGDDYLPFRISMGPEDTQGFVFWFRRGSERVRWDAIPEGSAVPSRGGG